MSAVQKYNTTTRTMSFAGDFETLSSVAEAVPDLCSAVRYGPSGGLQHFAKRRIGRSLLGAVQHRDQRPSSVDAGQGGEALFTIGAAYGMPPPMSLSPPNDAGVKPLHLGASFLSGKRRLYSDLGSGNGSEKRAQKYTKKTTASILPWSTGIEAPVPTYTVQKTTAGKPSRWGVKIEVPEPTHTARNTGESNPEGGACRL